MSNKSNQKDLDVLHDEAEQAVKNYVDFLRANHDKGLPDPDLAREVLYLLDFDHRSALWEYNDNILHVLAALTKPEAKEPLVKAASLNSVDSVIEILRRMIYFFHEIQESEAYLAALDYMKLDIAGSDKGDEAELQKIAIKYTCRLEEAKKLSEIPTTDNN